MNVKNVGKISTGNHMSLYTREFTKEKNSIKEQNVMKLSTGRQL